MEFRRVSEGFRAVQGLRAGLGFEGVRFAGFRAEVLGA